MNQFNTLIYYEMKKIVKNKITLAAFIFLLITAFVQVMFNMYGFVDGKPEYVEKFSKISGRLFDDELYQEVVSNCLDEYGYKVKDKSYVEILYFIQGILREVPLADYDAGEIYEKREHIMEERFENERLTKEEISYLEKMEQQIEKPFVWETRTAAFSIVDGLRSYVLIGLFFTIVCLSTVFAGEHRRKTDQMILCSKYGTGITYCSKVAAGSVFILISMIIAVGIYFAITCIVFGTDGFQAMVQLYAPTSILPITIGKLIGMTFTILLIVMLMYSMITLILSEWLKNGVAVMGVMMGSFFVLRVAAASISPYQFRYLSQILCMEPSVMINNIGIEYRLVHIGGKYFMSHQIVPVFYIIVCMVVFFAGKRVYLKYQVGK